MRRRALPWECSHLHPRLTVTFGLALFVLVASGCQRAQPKPVPAKTPEVFVAQPTHETVTDYEEFTGRTMAINTIEIRARVSGYLDAVHFKDGTEVNQGDLLFEIDPRTYDAEVARNKALIEQSQARLERLKRAEDRFTKLIANGTITKEQFDQAVFDRQEAEATVAAAVASRDAAQLNVGFTKIVAPISGRISRRLVDPGNLVQADQTPLATIVSVDPIYAYFDMDERTVLKLRRLANERATGSTQGPLSTVQISLADQEDFPLTGKIDFMDNQVDPTTGTLRVRAVIANPKLLLSPGLFVRLRVPVGEPHDALLVREESLGTDQGQRFLYVVDSEDKVTYRRVKVGQLTEGRRVIAEGIGPGDRVIVTGLQRVRPGAKVVPKAAEETAAGLATAARNESGDRRTGNGAK